MAYLEQFCTVLTSHYIYSSTNTVTPGIKTVVDFCDCDLFIQVCWNITIFPVKKKKEILWPCDWEMAESGVENL